MSELITRKTVHMCVDIAGVLAWGDDDLVGLFTDREWNTTSALCIRRWLSVQLESGKRKLPIGIPCEGFSDQTGCPGHQLEAE